MLPDIRKGDVHDDDRCRIERDPRSDLYLWLDMGIQGAAIATVISMAAGAAFVMSHFISKDSIVRFHTKYFRLKGPIIGIYLRSVCLHSPCSWRVV